MQTEERVDLADPDTYARCIPHDTFRYLRHEAPVHFHAERGGRGFWAITRHADIAAVSKDPGRFSSHRGGTSIEDYPPDDLSLIRIMMLNMDPPQHAKYRRLVAAGFTSLAISFLEPRIRAVTKEILDRIPPEGEIDFVSAVAAELPLRAIAELLGIPPEDYQQIFNWSNRLIGFDDPELTTSFEDAKIAAAQVWQYASGLAEQRRAQGGLDLLSRLISADVDGERLTQADLDSFFLLLAVAGNETTRNAISGGMLALMEHPEQRARVSADSSLMPSAVEEMLRWVSPVICFRRTATRDTELRGQQIREGDKVVLFYPSANRDEAVFPDADRFDVARTPNEHLAFGAGEHYCLGASLARLEIRVLFTELLRRFPGMELAGPVRRLRSKFINGIKRMPVRVAPKAQRA